MKNLIKEMPVNVFSISLFFVLMLSIAGCSENGGKSKAEAPMPAVTLNELSLEEKFSEAKRKAEEGNADAQLQLGLMYIEGEGATRDSVKAAEWWHKAAAQGNTGAQTNLGVMHYRGDGVPKDVAKAVDWFQKAAVQGDAGAQKKLGEIYFSGDGVHKDAIKAMEWWHKAAAQGDADAQNRLGIMYNEGEGVPKDAAKAVEWYQKAAVQGHVSAQNQLGIMYDKGEGVPKDAAKAAEWYLKAAVQDDPHAQYNLGAMYSKGVGVPLDMTRAYAWVNLAAVHGDARAKEFRDLLEKLLLTSAQRAEGQRMASNWKKGDTLLATGDAAKPAGGKPSKQGTGTAFLVSSAGHALTNHHVIKGCAEVRISGREGAAKVITSDSVNDLALLQLPEKAKHFARLNPDPGKLRQGEDIIVFGYPLEWVLSSGGNLTPGTISALTGLGNNTNQIQITAPIQPGSSGSPVMDKQGNVMGVVAMKLDDGKMAKATGQIGQNVNFAVNGQTVKAFLDANKVSYKVGGGFFSREQTNADIAEEARKWTVLVECWK